MDRQELTKIIQILNTHEEGDGDYCDTGEDMEWACRSTCVRHAEERLRKAIDNGEIIIND